jgi:hypothetical protein
MSEPHNFTIKNYKDSWNCGPPWPECTECSPDARREGCLTYDEKQPTLNEHPLPCAQDPELLSPQAPEFHPAAYYQMYSPFDRNRRYRSLPSRRYRGHLTPRPPIRVASYRGTRGDRINSQYFAPAEAVATTGFFPSLGTNIEAGYNGTEYMGHRLGENYRAWNVVPAQSRAPQSQIQENSYRETVRSNLTEHDIDIQSHGPVPQSQLSLPGESGLRATSTEFVSQGQLPIQPMDLLFLPHHSPIGGRYPSSQYATDHY